MFALKTRRKSPESGPTRACLRLALVGALCVLLLAACGKPPEGPPNILLITIDTLRADHLSCYGFADRKTKTIDRLAKEGVLFEAAHSDASWTIPSMVSTFTGMYASRHGFRSYYDVVPDGLTTVTESLKSGGYRTGAVIGSYPLDSIFGLGQGFDVYDDRFTIPMFKGSSASVKHVESELKGTNMDKHLQIRDKAVNDSWRPDNEVTDAATKMLRQFTAEKGPFFMWVHYFGAHSHPDFSNPPLKNMRIHLDSYPDKIVNIDKEIGRLLKALGKTGLKDHTLIIVHADHGENLGEHNFIGHGRYVYETALHVPLIMRWPARIPEGLRIDGLVGNIDIAPTIIEAAGTELPDATIDGKSLFQAIEKGRGLHEILYGETYMPAHIGFAEDVTTPEGEETKIGVWRAGVLRPPWKYIVTEPFPLYEEPEKKVSVENRREVKREELYNLEEDPGETRNRAPGEAELAGRLKESLAYFRALASGQSDVNRIDVTDEHLEKLRSLGYVE